MSRKRQKISKKFFVFFYGDTLTATVECKEKSDEKHRIVFQTTVVNQNEKLVTNGEARVMKK